MTVLNLDRFRSADAAEHYEAQQAHAGRLEAAKQRATEELTTKFLIALTGEKVTLPSVVRAPLGNITRIESRPLIEHVTEAVDHLQVLEALLLVLKDSQCELVKSLRRRMAVAYAATHAEDMAEWDCA